MARRAGAHTDEDREGRDQQEDQNAGDDTSEEQLLDVGLGDDAEFIDEVYSLLGHRSSLYLVKLVHKKHKAYHDAFRELYFTYKSIPDEEFQALQARSERWGIDRYQQERIRIDVMYKHPDNQRIVDEYKNILIDCNRKGSISQPENARLTRLKTLSVRNKIPSALFYTLDEMLKHDKLVDLDEQDYLAETRQVLEGIFLTEAQIDASITAEDMKLLLHAKRQAELQVLGILSAFTCHSAEPFLQKTNLFEEGKDGFCSYRIPGIIVTAKGSVLVYCEARKYSSADRGEIEIHLRRSTDGGRTWSPPKQVAHLGPRLPRNPNNSAKPRKSRGGPEEQTVNNPVAIAARDGTVHLLYCVEYMRCFHIRSDDDGVTWSAPVEITSAFDQFRPELDWQVIATGPGHAIQLKNGRLIVPVWLSTGTPSASSSVRSACCCAG